jgi:hypothetical protein
LVNVWRSSPLDGAVSVNHRNAIGQYGLVAPTGTPDPIIATLTAAMANVLKSPDVLGRIHQLGTEPGDQVSGAAFSAFMQTERKRWSDVIRIVWRGQATGSDGGYPGQQFFPTVLALFSRPQIRRAYHPRPFRYFCFHSLAEYFRITPDRFKTNGCQPRLNFGVGDDLGNFLM